MPFDPSLLDPSVIPFEMIAFLVMTIFTIGGAIGVVASKSLFHSAMYLIASLFGVAGYYAILSAGFLAAVQLMVYIGAIAILILFAIMFSRDFTGRTQSQNNAQWWLSAPIALFLWVGLIGVVNVIQWPISEEVPTGDPIVQLGIDFFGGYLIPVMVIGVLLSVTLIGAVFMAREKTEAEIERAL